ncbi:uncharacterized protein MYCFIDRAFT_81372 [Pseudocercospora fijiensis CIRAD86]|uniref:Survival protein SurE-like phosphatase/nucleotidase domain-containing protein n=1 Tax=Pseudocercospora fijiensis (strain CIRAD86) TaxID=383855 RepID=M3A9K2_PSEFD|nr:uncharacterized protein MYCFIDRAFT_81372 [Pseudocercospora fijiensis CIRAD86]EME81301.1 hypothetical protein MYCFIDRAFT_81372 [Pseudocercospora fijiensis CIRAD86]
MRPLTLLPLFLPSTSFAINILQSNDDGWAEINIRELYNSLTTCGANFSSIISAPAENESGTGSADTPPTQVGDKGCEFQSCPPNSPPTGKNESEPRWNYVNSYPVPSIRHGIQTLSPKFFGGPPDLAVTGFNVGTNLGIVTAISGTVGAAVEAAKFGIPAIAFSGSTGSQTAWNSPVEEYVKIYAELSTNVTKTLTERERPWMARDTWLNVNFPAVSETCKSASDFKFVLSRIYPKVPIVGAPDVETCGSDELPTERTVVGTKGCYASISVGDLSKTDASAEDQAVVLEKLKPILSCLPSEI